jgi:pyridoxal phosphate enzyme (YggS family)
MTDIAENLGVVRERIAGACRRAGRDPGSVRLVAVSKTMPAAAVEAAWRAGQRIFGENYVQELVRKDDALKPLGGIEWHFIGRLQKNKVRLVLGRVRLLQTVDSVKLVQEIDRRAADAGVEVEALVQVNVGAEAQKGGSLADEAQTVIGAVAASRRVKLRGLMAIPPIEENPEDSRKWFVMMHELREKLGGEKALPELSMGMSGDYEAAIEEGATIVRVGTAIFGERGRA